MTQILWLTEHHPPSRGGMAQSSDRITRGLRCAGVLVDVVQLARHAPGPRLTSGLGGSTLVHPLGADPEHGLATAWLEVDRQRARAGRAYTHLVAFGGTWAMTAAPIYAAWLGIRLVTLLRGVDFDQGVFSLRRRAALFDALRSSAAVVTVASRTAEQVRALVPQVRVEYIANSIDTTDWALVNSDRTRAQTWRAADVPPGKRVLGLIGQLKPKKGVLDLLRALANSPAKEEFHVLLVGELDPAIEEWLAAAPSGLTWSRLAFLDRFELAWVYAACDLIALPSLHDGLPNVALEAAALGRPLLASDAGGLGDLQRAGAVAYPFPAGDWDACARALTAAAEADDAELARLGEQARQVIVSEFTPDRETAAYCRVLAETAG